MYPPFYGLEVVDRQGGIELHHFVVRRARERRRLAGGAQDDAKTRPGFLRVWKIEARSENYIEIGVFDIADDADDLHRFIRFAGMRNPLPNGFLIRKESAGEGLIDDHDSCCLLVIARGEAATASNDLPIASKYPGVTMR